VRPALNAVPPVTACDDPREQCVLLARLNFNVGNNWMVLGSVAVDESDRPFLVQTRLLQEAALSGLLGEGLGGGAQSSSVVAAGTFLISGSTATAVGPTIGQLMATKPGGLPPGGFLLNWAGDKPYVNPLGSPPNPVMYIVKGTPYLSPIANRQSFEVLAFRNDGVLVRILDTTGGATAAGFMVEISEITAGA